MTTLPTPTSPRSNKKTDSTLLLNCHYLDNNGQLQDVTPAYWIQQLEQQKQVLQYKSSQSTVQGQELLQADDFELENAALEAFYHFLALVFSKTWAEKKQANMQALKSFHKVRSLHKPTHFRQLFSSFATKDYLLSTYCCSYLYARPTQNTQILSMYSYLLSEGEALLLQHQHSFALKHFMAIVYQQQALIAGEELSNQHQTFHIDFFAVKQNFEKSIQNDSQFAIFYCNASQFLWKYNFLQEALQMINQAIEIDPQDESFFISRGCIRFQNKEWRQLTRQDFETAIQINPSCATAHCNLGTTLELLFWEPSKALQHYCKSYQLDPTNQTINLVYIARILFAYGMDRETSLDLLHRITSSNDNPHRQVAQQHSSVIYTSLEESYLAKKFSSSSLRQNHLLYSHHLSCDDYFQSVIDSSVI